ncbi:MAG: FAD binding domain-containing protein, partial [Pseudomonadota bacterium]
MQMLRPESVEEAVAALAQGGWRPLAGGTDVYPSLGQAPVPPLLDLTGIAAMRGISIGTDTIRIGALATWSDVVAAPLPPAFDALKTAAQQVGGVQVQNAGTVAGNICNASPAADGVPPLLALDASVELAGPAARRVLPPGAFITGVRQTALHADEIVTAILVPSPDPSARSA